MIKINKIPEEVMFIIQELNRDGYEAYIVGGALRDSILNKPVHDWDICTSATPDEIIKTFPYEDIIPTGLKHGTITIVINDNHYEITTFRIDGDYSDGRRPDNVEFTTNIFEDLRRRDFTINAMAYNPFQGFVDPFNGIEDIKNKIIRCVGNPNDRFNEDGLRILRSIRFSAQLGFTIEEETSKSIHRNKLLLNTISKERIQSELFKILESNYCGNNILRKYSDIICQCIPEIKPMIGFEQNNPYHIYDVWEHTLHCMDFLVYYDDKYKNIILRLAVLLHDVGKPYCYSEDNDGIGHFYHHANISCDMSEKILKNLKCSNDIIDNVCELIKNHDVQFVPTRSFVKRMLNKLGETQLRRLIILKNCDIYGQKQNQSGERIEKLFDIICILNEIIVENECFKLKDLAINGNDLIEYGIPQGKIIGSILNELLYMVIDNEVNNDKNELLKMTDFIFKSKYKEDVL